MLASGALVVDALRHAVRDAHGPISLARRPVLFALLRALAAAWPDDVDRSTLIARVFIKRLRRINRDTISMNAELTRVVAGDTSR